MFLAQKMLLSVGRGRVKPSTLFLIAGPCHPWGRFGARFGGGPFHKEGRAGALGPSMRSRCPDVNLSLRAL
jgi:hypothetical protein